MCINSRRLQNMKETCARYADDSGEDTSFNENDPSNYRYLIVDDTDKLLYCLVGKTGSTSFTKMMRNKFDMDNNTYIGFVDEERAMLFIKDTPLYTLDYIKNATERQYKLNNYQAFLIARNPYSRIYSAYLHKYEQLLRFVDENVQVHQPIQQTQQANNSSFLSFNKFLQLLVLAKNTNLTAFNNHKLNTHFTSVWSRCHPCHIRYDYVFKTETLDKDRDIFLPLMNRNRLIHKNKAETRIHPLVGTDIGQEDIMDPITAIQKIPAQTLVEITDLYRQDNEVFGYGLDSDQTPISVV